MATWMNIRISCWAARTAVKKMEKAAAPAAKPLKKLMTPVIKKKIQELDLKMLKIKDKIILLEQALADHTIYIAGTKEGRGFCPAQEQV